MFVSSDAIHSFGRESGIWNAVNRSVGRRWLSPTSLNALPMGIWNNIPLGPTRTTSAARNSSSSVTNHRNALHRPYMDARATVLPESAAILTSRLIEQQNSSSSENSESPLS